MLLAVNQKTIQMDTRALDNRYLRKVNDLGSVTQPLLICGGAYSNLEALKMVLEIAAGLDIPNERVIHTGDVIAYCADPVKTACLLREARVQAIQGNVEESLWASMPDCGCGYDEGTLCEKLSAEWFAYADSLIDNELRTWMGRLPYQLAFTMQGRRVRVVHGGVREINTFFYASTPADKLAAEFEAGDADIVIAGHSGLPFTRQEGMRVWHNSGPLGLPANDGTPRVWFSLMIPENGIVRFEHHALRYDHEAAHAKVVKAGLPGGYAEALLNGLWPSLDILPKRERAMTGVPLTPKMFEISNSESMIASRAV